MTVPILVPAGKDPSDLTVGELDTASRHLSADVLECMAGQVPGKRYAACIELAVIWSKRDPETKATTAQLIEKFRAYDMDDMFHALRMDEPAAGDAPDPTSSTAASSESP